MKLRTIFIQKIILGAVLIAICAAVTFFIKESLDTQDPEAALPLITIQYINDDFPSQNIYRAGYTWSFITTMETWQAPSLAPEDLPIVPQEVLPNESIKIIFSQTPDEINVWRASGRYSTDFLEISMDTPGEFFTPSTSGEYLYRIVANWGSRGEIQYYFSLNVT